MMTPTLPGWKVETVGDDIAWMKFGSDGRLHAINPRQDSWRRAWHQHEDNPNALRTAASTRSSPIARSRRRRRVVGGHERPPARRGDRLAAAAMGAGSWAQVGPSQRPLHGARAAVPGDLAEWENPAGVPISAILFGGRRGTVIPLVNESKSWQHGTFLGPS
jgi:phosphoenolpyruvate carboxykinase (GTP)